MADLGVNCKIILGTKQVYCMEYRVQSLNLTCLNGTALQMSNDPPSNESHAGAYEGGHPWGRLF